MSEQPIDPKSPVTFEMFKAVIGEMQSTFNDALKKRDDQNEARFTQFSEVLRQVAENMKAPQANGLAIDKDTIVQKVVDRAIAKLAGDDEDPASDIDFQQYKKNIHALYNLGIKRAIQATDVLIKKELKMPTASNRIAEKMITEDLGHSPA